MTRLPTLQAPVCRTGATCCRDFAAEESGVCRMAFRRVDTGRNACALDIADEGPVDLHVIAAMFGYSPEYARQLLANALQTAHKRARLMRLEDLVDAKPRHRTQATAFVASEPRKPEPERHCRPRFAVVLRLVGDGIATPAAMAAATNSTAGHMLLALKRLAAKRLVVCDSGRWSLAS